MIALRNVHSKSRWVNNPGSHSPASGQDLVVDGDNEMHFSGGGGGKVGVFMFDLMIPAQPLRPY